MTKPLTNVQLELLQSFNYKLDEAEFAQFRQMLVDYFAEKITKEYRSTFRGKGLGGRKVSRMGGHPHAYIL